MRITFTQAMSGVHLSNMWFYNIIYSFFVWFYGVLYDFSCYVDAFMNSNFWSQNPRPGVKIVELSPVLSKILSGGSRLFPAVMAALLSPWPVKSPSFEVVPRLLSLMQVLQLAQPNFPAPSKPGQ